jgi:hypothetical protein
MTDRIRDRTLVMRVLPASLQAKLREKMREAELDNVSVCDVMPIRSNSSFVVSARPYVARKKLLCLFFSFKLLCAADMPI